MEIKKSGKGLKVLVGLLAVLLIAAIGYIVVDKFVPNNAVDNKESENNISNEGDTKELSQMEVSSLHKTLTTEAKNLGLYFDHNVTIDNISLEDFMPYVLNSFADYAHVQVIDGARIYNGKVYVDGDDGDCEGVKCPEIAAYAVPKEKVDNYIKEKYNTNRVFNIGEDTEIFLWYKYTVYYSKETNSFYFIALHRGFMIIDIANLISKYEQKDNQLHIYDKVIVVGREGQGIVWSKDFDNIPSDEGNERYEILPIDGMYDGLKYEDITNEYLFTKNESKLNTYKHTFKKGNDGKYYWYSSEIVK